MTRAGSTEVVQEWTKVLAAVDPRSGVWWMQFTDEIGVKCVKVIWRASSAKISDIKC